MELNYIMKNNYEVGQAILDMNGYSNVQFKQCKTKVEAERCKMMKDGSATIFLGKKSVAEGAIQVASHEVGHYLTYSEGITNPRKLKRWNFYMGLSFAGVICSGIAFPFIDNLIGISVLLFIMGLSISVGVKYLTMYKEDEILAEKRGLKELYTLQNKSLEEFSFDMVTIKAIVDYRIKRYIVGKVRNMKLFFVILPLVAIIIKLIDITFLNCYISNMGDLI